MSILAEHQTDVSAKFAKPSTDKFSGVETVEGLAGIPLIKGASAYLECRKVSSFPGGDHAIFLGRVDRMERSARRPLVFGGGRYLVAYPHDLGGFSIDLGSPGSLICMPSGSAPPKWRASPPSFAPPRASASGEHTGRRSCAGRNPPGR